MTHETSRRKFLSMAAASGAGIALAGLAASANASSPAGTARSAFGPVRQIDAGPLDVGYVDLGPRDGTPVLLFHGWPYDIHSYEDVASWPRWATGSWCRTCAATAARASCRARRCDRRSRRHWPRMRSR